MAVYVDDHGTELVVEGSKGIASLLALGWVLKDAPAAEVADPEQGGDPASPDEQEESHDDDPGESTPSSEEEDPYDEWSKDELKAEAKERGLKVTGTKDELIARLTEDDDAA